VTVLFIPITGITRITHLIFTLLLEFFLSLSACQQANPPSSDLTHVVYP
jgi:hypothetical protein